MNNPSRRALLGAGAAAAVAVVGGSLMAVGRRFGLVPPDAVGVFGPGATLTYAAHRLFGRNAMAREFPREMISEDPFAYPATPRDENFPRHESEGFRNWRLELEGLVERPTSLSLSDLRRLPSASQITELACEEGWSYIAEWTGTPLATVLARSGVRPEARYVVYFSTDPYWWESIDIDEAMHPQTLLSWGMNGADLPVPFGGPLRLRVPRQLGYKSIKFLNRIVVTDSLDAFGDGSGQSAANAGYAWYAGI